MLGHDLRPASGSSRQEVSPLVPREQLYHNTVHDQLVELSLPSAHLWIKACKICKHILSTAMQEWSRTEKRKPQSNLFDTVVFLCWCCVGLGRSYKILQKPNQIWTALVGQINNPANPEISKILIVHQLLCVWGIGKNPLAIDIYSTNLYRFKL